jgi:hypothetical protein
LIPLSQIAARVRTKFEAESTARWTDQGIYDAVNEGLEELAEATLFFERYVTIPLVADRTYYDLRGYLPESAIGVTSVWDTTTSAWLTPINQGDLGFRWEESAGEPQFYFLRGANWLGVWPKVSTTSGFIRVHFAGLPPRFTTPQSVLSDLPDDYVPALEEYALYELSAQDGETDKAIAHYQEYAAKEKSLADFVSRRTATARVGRVGGRR